MPFLSVKSPSFGLRVNGEPPYNSYISGSQRHPSRSKTSNLGKLGMMILSFWVLTQSYRIWQDFMLFERKQTGNLLLPRALLKKYISDQWNLVNTYFAEENIWHPSNRFQIFRKMSFIHLDSSEKDISCYLRMSISKRMPHNFSFFIMFTNNQNITKSK